MSGVVLSPVGAAPVILSEGLGQRKPPFLVSALAGRRGGCNGQPRPACQPVLPQRVLTWACWAG